MRSFLAKQNEKLHRFLIEQFNKEFSSKKLKELLDLGRVRVNGKIETFGTRQIKIGDLVEVNDDFFEKPKFDQSRILYQDDALLIYNKPPNLECLQQTIEKFFPGKWILGHRLDKMTSGVLILCKSEKIADILKVSFQERNVEKTYLALVDGILEKSKGHLETYLGKVATIPGQTIYGKVNAKSGKLAILDFEVIETKKDCTLVAIYPLTGRTHQVRVQMALIGHPILSDPLYGKHYRSTYFAKRTLLHCQMMKFDHPFTKKPLISMAPLELDFKMVLKELEFCFEFLKKFSIK